MTHKLIIIAALLLQFTWAEAAAAGRPARDDYEGYWYTEASDLTLVGKLMDTPNPYHRVDTVAYTGFTRGENVQVRSSSGIAVAFETDSETITVWTDYGYRNRANNTMGIALRGYDLYIRDNGKWKFAAAKAPSETKEDQNLVLIEDMGRSKKECLLYLPLYSEEYSIRIGTDKGSTIRPLDNPFRHRVGIFGSSFTHGISASRAGMTYPAQFSRNTGIQMLSLGCSGNCKMQSYFADVLCDADVDALVFDCFSNPSAEMIEERLFPFIHRLQESHPDIPLIFQQTIYREGRNFSKAVDKREKEKIAMARKMMKKAMKEFENVYFIFPDATDRKHETSVDGIHPDNNGYSLWAKSIERPIKKILKKHGLK